MSDSVIGNKPVREVLAYALMVAKGANSLQYDDADITIAAIQREAVDVFIADELPALIAHGLYAAEHGDEPPEIAARVGELRKA